MKPEQNSRQDAKILAEYCEDRQETGKAAWDTHR